MHSQMILLTTGEFLNPLIAWKMPPPIAPIVKAPPQSSTILQGLQRKTKTKILNSIMLNRNGSTTHTLSVFTLEIHHQNMCHSIQNWRESQACQLYCLTSSLLSRPQQNTGTGNITAKQTRLLPRVYQPASLEWQASNIQKNCLNSSHKAERRISIMENFCRIPALSYLCSVNSFKFTVLILVLTYRKLKWQIQ